MIQTINPYDCIKKSLIVDSFIWKDRYYIRDESGNTYEVDFKVFEEINNDRN